MPPAPQQMAPQTPPATQTPPTKPKKDLPALLAATDDLIGFVSPFMSSRPDGRLDEAEWKKLCELDEAFGKQVKAYGGRFAMLPQPPAAYSQMRGLPYSRLLWRHAPASPSPMLNGAIPARWWVMGLETWVPIMQNFRDEAANGEG